MGSCVPIFSRSVHFEEKMPEKNDLQTMSMVTWFYLFSEQYLIRAWTEWMMRLPSLEEDVRQRCERNLGFAILIESRFKRYNPSCISKSLYFG